MNGSADLGGMMGFGAVAPEAGEPVFHAEWEKRALAITLAMGATGQWTIDLNRHTRESLPWVQYLSSSYYEIWIAALETRLAAHGLLEGAPKPVRTLKGADVASVLAKGTRYARETSSMPKFGVGDRVQTIRCQSEGHTRLPAYLRGALGEVVANHGGFVFPDENAKGNDTASHLYTVRFAAREVFGRDGNDLLHADLFEPYLEAA